MATCWASSTTGSSTPVMRSARASLVRRAGDLCRAARGRGFSSHPSRGGTASPPRSHGDVPRVAGRHPRPARRLRSIRSARASLVRRAGVLCRAARGRGFSSHPSRGGTAAAAAIPWRRAARRWASSTPGSSTSVDSLCPGIAGPAGRRSVSHGATWRTCLQKKRRPRAASNRTGSGGACCRPAPPLMRYCRTKPIFCICAFFASARTFASTP